VCGIRVDGYSVLFYNTEWDDDGAHGARGFAQTPVDGVMGPDVGTHHSGDGARAAGGRGKDAISSSHRSLDLNSPTGLAARRSPAQYGAYRMHDDRGMSVSKSRSVENNWICIAGRCWSLPPFAATLCNAILRALARITSRVSSGVWVRYRIDLAETRREPSDASLMEVTDHLIAELRRHPDAKQNQLQSGFRFWEHGLRRAFVWYGDEGPLCIQWLLTGSDGARLQSLPVWADMYPPLPQGYGQVENLFTFSTARRKGVARQFEYMLYEEARHLGLRGLYTHIYAGNDAARAWAERTEWRAFGIIRRCTFEIPGLRGVSCCVHCTRVSDIHPPDDESVR